MNVLISGAGIAGPTLAFWLERYGFAPTLVESAPALRASGYVIDFWGLGYSYCVSNRGFLPRCGSAHCSKDISGESWRARR